jgi:hypothetical protein
MLVERTRIAGIALIAAALAVTIWKTFAAGPEMLARDESIRSVSTAPAGGAAELTIPVEIVETGEAPRFHEVRVTR